MDLALIKELFQNLSLAAEVLEIQDDIVEEVRKSMDRTSRISDWSIWTNSGMGERLSGTGSGASPFFRSSGISSGDNHQSI